MHGATEEIGQKAAEDRVSALDFHATLLHLLGMNFGDLTFERHGLSERLIDKFPKVVVEKILT